jgi:hypothetical protein
MQEFYFYVSQATPELTNKQSILTERLHIVSSSNVNQRAAQQS